ncbi:hypothetical protein [Alkalicoccus halolimnae]|uniref:DUF3939 domain-containing protein n=1 Tax=Alkalicoccus halolimnae TaxID=1667239 RepID=A0A5C7FAC9_9BACI|nr:hypothetical protein [Alkalicoccus halolimnae]TXF83015.1 hypothetical protein FTX54_13515 [Alkalicoccus halolimnae]
MRIKPLIFAAVSVLLLSGCLYPQEERSRDSGPNQEQLERVQTAVTQFHQNTGVLPIATREADTPIFRKYPVQFTQLIPTYLSEPPGNSFENGGTYQYVLINVEEMPEVKLIDLTTVRKIQELETRLFTYRSTNDYAPVEEVIGNELLKLDYEALGYEEEPVVDSPFHPDHLLPLLYTTDGDVVIDYSLDIRHYMEEYGMGEYEEGDDLRWLLVDEAPFVPAYSLPQTVENGEIHFIKEEN